MLNERYTIAVHSFVDLITNSSTEIYIEASQKTIESLKSLIDNLLKLGKSKLICDDLFTIEIDKEQFNRTYGYDDVYPIYDKWIQENYRDSYRDVRLLVKCRDENNELGKQTAQVLSTLTSMFEMNASYEMDNI